MKIILLISLILVSSLEIIAQTNNSPYSILGIGDIEDSYYNRTSGLANTGIAYRSNRNLINNNPASFSALDNQFFTGEIGLRGKLVSYYGDKINASNNQSSDITFRRLAFGTKITKNWGSSVGLIPFSSQNYEFNSPQFIGATESANAYSQGNGGINRVYWTNSYELFKHISLGVNASYLFGSLSQKTILQDANQVSLVSTTHSINLNNLYFDYGIQYYGKLGKKWEFCLGATFANKTDLSAQYKLLVLNSDSVALKDITLKETYFTLPTSYGMGFSITKDKKYSFIADYKYQGWASLHYSGPNYSLENSTRISAGFEISKKKNIYNNLFETNYFQAGVYYGDSYLKINGEQIKDMGATLGIGINSKRNPLSYIVTLQYGIKGTQNNGLIQERYTNLTIMISYRDLWYTRGKKYE